MKGRKHKLSLLNQEWIRRKGTAGSDRIATSYPIEVACAVILERGKILITRREPGVHLSGLWEFPGGKRMACESLSRCLERELLEELGIQVEPRRLLRRIDYIYPEKSVSLYFYECRLTNGRPTARTVAEFRWIWPFEIENYTFPLADEAFLKDLSPIVRLGQIIP